MRRSRARDLVAEISPSTWKEGEPSLLDESSFIYDILSLFPENGEGRTVLDIGIGKGYRSIPLSFMNYRVYGIESSWQTIYSWKDSYYRPYGIRVKECDISSEAFPFPDDHFDWVIMGGQSERYDISAAHTLSEIKRITKPGARFILHLPNRARYVTEHRTSLRWRASGALGKIELEQDAEIDTGQAPTVRELPDLAEGYGFRTVLKLYRNMKPEPGIAVSERIHRVLSLLVPRFRDAVILVCEKK